MEVIVTPQAQHQLAKLPSIQRKKIAKKLLLLEADPLAGKKLSGELEGSRSLKVWPYRILYLIKESSKDVWVTSILHRQGAYKK